MDDPSVLQILIKDKILAKWSQDKTRVTQGEKDLVRWK